MKAFIWDNLRRVINSILVMRVSLQIIVLLIFLFLAVISGSFLAINQLKIFRHDAFAINNLGVIRGAIQRISKKEMNMQPSESLITVVDSTFNSVETTYFLNNENSSYLINEDVYKKLDSLNLAWSDLKNLFLDYRQKQVGKNQVLLQSELCWNLANELVFSVQKINEEKLKNYKNLIIYILLIVGLFIFGIIMLVYKIVHNSLEFDVITDPMTKLFNRMYFSKIMHKQVTLARRYDYIFSLILFDIDNFKLINDDFGHQSGDKVLIHISELLKEHARDVDYVFRLGGEEFAIIVPEATMVQAAKIAEKHRVLISETTFEVDRAVTVSIGVSQFVNNEDIDEDILFKHADKALYKAKSSGRNQVVTLAV